MNQLSSLAEKIAAPLKNTGKMIFVSGDGSGPSKLTTDIGNIMAGLPDTVETMTGMNIKNVLKRLEGKQGGGREHGLKRVRRHRLLHCLCTPRHHVRCFDFRIRPVDPPGLSERAAAHFENATIARHARGEHIPKLREGTGTQRLAS